MVVCAHCGRDLSPQAVACPACGHPGPAMPRPGSVGDMVRSAGASDPYAIASLACSLSPLVGFLVVGSVLGVVFGKIAEGRIAADPNLGGEGLARAGIIIGWVGLGLTGALAVLFLAALIPLLPFL